MTKYVIYPEQSITNISDAIKEKLGTEDRIDYTVNEMPNAIRSINSGGNSNNKVHTMNFNIFNDESSPSEMNEGEFISTSYDDTVFISKEHLREIIEYYAAGYQVEITTPPPENYRDYSYSAGEYVDVTINEESIKFIVNNIFDNLYDGMIYSTYERLSGAAVAISCFYPGYENLNNNIDAYPHRYSSHWLTYILRDVVTIAEGDEMYYY